MCVSINTDTDTEDRNRHNNLKNKTKGKNKQTVCLNADVRCTHIHTQTDKYTKNLDQEDRRRQGATV